MLIEQAFMALPEFLLGAPYLQYDEEGTLVMAFSMALLQELNGRNINNPISLVRGEVRYPTAPTRSADLHLALTPLGVLTDELRRYGYREQAWLEAKFFRRNDAGAVNTDSTAATLSLLADLVRLSVLPPEAAGGRAGCARHLLHAYEGDPTGFHAFRKNTQQAVAPTATSPAVPARAAFDRTWTQALRTPGRQTLEGFNAPNEVGGFDGTVGASLRALELRLVVTNFVHAPSTTTNDNFFIVLTRLDEVHVTMTVAGVAQTMTITNDGVTEAPAGALAAIQTAVAAGLAS